MAESKIAKLSLKELRHRRGLTVEAVALLSGLDRSQVSRLERGMHKPRPTTVVKLARALGLSVFTMRDILANSTPDEPTAEPEPARGSA